MPWRFFDSRARLKRAETHINNMAEIWSRFLDDDPYQPVVHVDDDGKGTISVLPDEHFPGEELSLELGEALYQLRAALDSCVYTAACIDSGQTPPPDEEKLGFPICRTEQSWIRAAGQITPLADLRREMISDMQPCHAAKQSAGLREVSDVLDMLNDWARKDRHRRLRVIGSWGAERKPELRLPDGVSIKWFTVTSDGFLEHQSVVAEFALEGWERDMHAQGNPDLMIEIAADEPPPRVDAEDTLHRRLSYMVISVRTVIEGFEESYRPPFATPSLA